MESINIITPADSYKCCDFDLNLKINHDTSVYNYNRVKKCIYTLKHVYIHLFLTIILNPRECLVCERTIDLLLVIKKHQN
jgi:hypothetical protein